MHACGLDFGTSNSAVALANGEVLPIDPAAESVRLFRSVLFFPEEERGYHVGAEAIARYVEEGAGRFIQSVKSWLPSKSFHATQIRNRAMTLEDLVALVLGALRTRAEALTGTTLRRVILGRPAVFSPLPEADALAERRLRRAAELAGFEEVVTLIEPIAAALAYEAALTRDERVLVADFGAGTSDFTLMDLGPSRRADVHGAREVIGSHGVRIGGDDFDAVIMRHKLLPKFGAGSYYRPHGKRLRMPRHVENKLLSWHEMSFIREPSTQQLLEVLLATSEDKPAIEALHDLVMFNLGYHLFRAIERAKVKLSFERRATVDFEEDRIHLHESISREEFDEMSRPLLEGLGACVDSLLARHGGGAAIDAVFLTGGSSHVPSVRALFAERFGEERLRRTSDAFTSVVEGLGRASAMQWGSERSER